MFNGTILFKNVKKVKVLGIVIDKVKGDAGKKIN